jgi:predicted deacetylase
LHDVTPAHYRRLERAEALLARAGVTRVAYLVVPDFHSRNPVADDRAFEAWCARTRSFEVDWTLHGFYHLETEPPRGPVLAGLKRRWMTAGEGEFLALEFEEQRARLRAGLTALSRIGLRTNSFVPPAWLSNGNLHAALRAESIRFTEDHGFVFDVDARSRVFAPAISWSTRTWLRRLGARVLCPALTASATRQAAVRVAIHPFDMDYPATASQIERILTRLCQTWICGTYEDLFPAAL